MMRAGFILAFVASASGLAHDRGGAMVDPFGGAQLQVDVGAVQAMVSGEVTSARARSDDDPEFVEELRQQSLRAAIAFCPATGVVFGLEVPVLQKQLISTTSGYPPTVVRTAGLGDVTAALRYVLQRGHHGARSHTLAFSGGSTLPTGANLEQQNGYRLDEHAQLGSGAAAPFLSARYRLSTGSLNLNASVLGRYRLTNALDYQYGAGLFGSFGANYWPKEWLGAGLSLDGRFTARDAHRDVEQRHSGGFVLAATPAVYFALPEKVMLSVLMQLPVVQGLSGEQAALPTFSASLLYVIP